MVLNLNDTLVTFLKEFIQITSLTSVLSFFSIKNTKFDVKEIYDKVISSDSYKEFMEKNIRITPQTT